MQDEDKTYENEVRPLLNDDRGSLDLTKQIDELNKKVKNLNGLELWGECSTLQIA